MDNLLYSDDVKYMLAALRTLGLSVEDDSATKRAIVGGCGGKFPVGEESNKEVELFLGNAGTAMRPLTAAVTAAGGNARSFYAYLFGINTFFYIHMMFSFGSNVYLFPVTCWMGCQG